MRYFLGIAEGQGAQIVCRCPVISLKQEGEGYAIRIAERGGGEFTFTTKIVINSAGLEAHKLASKLGLNYRIFFCKGDYFSVGRGKNRLISHLLYPPPQSTSLGIHTVIDTGGRLRLGPDAEYIDEIKSYAVNEKKREIFFRATSKYLPFIELEDLAPDISGIRPKLQGPDDGFRDFEIQFQYPGAVHLLGIDSPGLTASPAIAEYVAQILRENAELK